jgi:hypothetical protein
MDRDGIRATDITTDMAMGRAGAGIIGIGGIIGTIGTESGA